MNIGKKSLCQIVQVAVALTVTYAIGKWSFYYAYLERGCKAVGGEYFLVAVTCWTTYKAGHCLLDAWEEKKHVDQGKDKEGRC